ncbi:sensor histidine kinase [Methylocapsa palsarum]|uniref:Blue-light-activated histidine kinase n=1 Tax=Methylocapsa palsarum TaxID=1612308 RepID=A0A1I3XK84_9HYPH|nr:HWE histidine kinase domain-containing protein [Methylocapsa palsarum]SFK19915.1 PAS domain S-box-containing protein [Methylocapsa palsarum]
MSLDIVATDFDFEALFESLPSPYMVLDTNLDIVAINQAYLDMTRRSRESLLGQNVFSAFPASDESRRILMESFQRVREYGLVDVLPVVHYGVAGIDGAEERSWSCTNVPIRDREGRVAFVLKQTQDISQLRKPEVAPNLMEASLDPQPGNLFERFEMVQVLNQTLLMTSRYLHRLFMEAPNFMCVLQGPDHVFELANLHFCTLAGDRDLRSKPIREAMPEIVGQECFAILDQVFRTGEAFSAPKMRVFLKNGKDGEIEEFFLDLVYQPVLDEKGAVASVFIEGCDVTGQARSEQRQSLLIRELHHRVRNTLATVQGVMNTTAKSSATIEEFQEAFTGRIASLAKTHSVMTEEMKQSVSFLQLLNQELCSHCDGEGRRIRLSGPAVDLPSQIAVPISMAIHELTTNAAKYGALAVEEGRIEIEWSMIELESGPGLLCEWREFDGPTVTPPAREGFGTMLLERVLAQQIKADVNAAYDPEGFRLRMIVPLQFENYALQAGRTRSDFHAGL